MDIEIQLITGEREVHDDGKVVWQNKQVQRFLVTGTTADTRWVKAEARRALAEMLEKAGAK